jgi:hypothetical protein
MNSEDAEIVDAMVAAVKADKDAKDAYEFMETAFVVAKHAIQRRLLSDLRCWSNAVVVEDDVVGRWPEDIEIYAKEHCGIEI